MRREKNRLMGVWKYPAVFEKERTLLGKEHLETLIDRHLRFVRFDLAEIRVQGEIEGERIARHDLRIDAGATRPLAVSYAATSRSRNARP